MNQVLNNITDYSFYKKNISNKYFSDTVVDLSVGLLDNYFNNKVFYPSYSYDDGNYMLVESSISDGYLFEDFKSDSSLRLKSIEQQLLYYIKHCGVENISNISVKVDTSSKSNFLLGSLLSSSTDFYLVDGDDLSLKTFRLPDIEMELSIKHSSGNLTVKLILSNIYAIREIDSLNNGYIYSHVYFNTSNMLKELKAYN